MIAQFVTDDNGKIISAIIPINKYEDFLHKRHLKFELTDEYKLMMNKMLAKEANETTKYVSFETIKAKFLKA